MTSKRVYTAGDRTPYTYLVGWTHLDRWYYGVKFGLKSHPDDFWINYFTSSKLVKQMVLDHGNPDVIEIRKTFDSPLAATKWEATVLQRLNVINDDRWINRSDRYNHRAIYKPSEKTKEKIRAKRKLQVMPPCSEEKKAKIRLKNTGQQRSPSAIAKQKASIAVRTCDRHPRAKPVVIYDNLGTPRFYCNGNFKQVCIDNDISYFILYRTCVEGTVVEPPNSPNHQSAATRMKILGWYAREVDDERLCA